MRWGKVVLAAAVFVAAGACTDEIGTAGGPCNGQGQCLPGLYCIEGVCLELEAARNHHCFSMQCGSVEGFECGACSGPTECVSHRCVVPPSDAGSSPDALLAVDTGPAPDSAAPPDAADLDAGYAADVSIAPDARDAGALDVPAADADPVDAGATDAEEVDAFGSDAGGPCGPASCGFVNDPGGVVDCGDCPGSTEECRNNHCVDLCPANACGTVQGFQRAVDCGPCSGSAACQNNQCIAGPWQELAQSSLRPYPRDDHAMTFDTQRRRLVVFGGSTTGRSGMSCDGSGTNVCGGLWLWDPVSTRWSITQVTPGPGNRRSAALAYDAARDRYVLFGGRSQYSGTVPCEWSTDNVCDATWTFDPATQFWTNVVLSGDRPAARTDHAMVYDSGRDRIVLFGGAATTATCDGGGTGYRCGDTWEWDGQSWTRAATTGPSPRANFGLAYDSVRGVVVLFGGEAAPGVDCDGHGNQDCDDTWEWNGTAWGQVSSSGVSPRDETSMAFHVQRGRAVLYGGRGDDHLGRSTVWDDTWEWSGGTWIRVNASGPGSRRSTPLAYDPVGQQVLLFGGSGGGGRTVPCNDVPGESYCNDIWAYAP